MSARRWNVEVQRDVFEDVGADSLELSNGALLFRREDGLPLVAYAPTTWLTVSLGEDDSKPWVKP